MNANKILFISQEIAPYVQETTLSVLGRDLPQSLQEKGVEVRTFMPRYGIINERRNQLHEVIRLSGMNIVIDDTDHPLIIKVATLQPSRMQVYFIDNDDYFLRHSTEGLETDTHAANNDERIIFFARGVIETAKKLRWVPSVIHCTGWVTALTPLYLKHIYADDPTFVDTRVVYTLFDNDFEGPLDARMAEKLSNDGLNDAVSTAEYDYLALNKLAIDNSDAVIVGTENVVPELIEYAKSTGKPVLEYPGADNFAQACAEFYASL